MILEYNIYNKYHEVRINLATDALIRHLKKANNVDKLDNNYYNKLRKLVNNKYIEPNSYFIDTAIKTNDEKIVDILLNSGLFYADNNSVILATQEYSNSKIMKVLLKNPQVNWKFIINDNQYPNIFRRLASNNRLDILKILLDDKNIQTLLKKISINDTIGSLIVRAHDDFLKILLPYCSFLGRNGNKLLCSAIEYNRHDIIELLLQDKGVLNEDMYDPFIKTIINNNKNIFDILINFVKDYEPDGDFGISDCVKYENYYMLDKILKTIDWSKQMKDNGLWKYTTKDISIFLKKYFENKDISNFEKNKVYEILRKYPIFFNQLRPDFYDSIKPTYTSRKINKFYDENENN